MNIRADGAINSEQGLFEPRIIEAERAFVWKTRASQKRRYWLGSPDRFLPEVAHSPLNQRAWVVQERFLAPRALHFGLNGCVYWECTALTASEVLPADFDLILPDEQMPKRMSRTAALQWTKTTNAFDKYEIWDRFARTYSMSKLTLESDRSIAISGLARVICKRLGLEPNDYLCGLWRPRFVQDLMWQRDRDLGEVSGRSTANQSPSWSWLSVEGEVLGGLSEYASRRLKEDWVWTVAELIDVEVLTQNSQTFGLVTGGSATLRGPLCKATLMPSGGCRQTEALQSMDHLVTIGGTTLAQDDPFELGLDDNTIAGLDQVFHTDLYLLVVSMCYERALFKSANTDKNKYKVTGRPECVCLSIHPSVEWADQCITILSHSGMPLNRHHGLPNAEPRRFECLVLSLSGDRGTFVRRRVVFFEMQSLRIGGDDFNPPNRMRRQWTADCLSLMKHFRTLHVSPDHYKAVDESLMYTIAII